MLFTIVSKPLAKLDTKTNDKINLFIQFYIDNHPHRHIEILTCLRKNVENPHIDNIYLLNERIYTEKELGITSNKIIQVNIQKRLMYSDVFHYINQTEVKGYIIIANSDILFDNTLENIRYSDLHNSKKMLTQLRYEYNPIDPSLSRIFGPRIDSQDAWILHTNNTIAQKHEKIFEFNMGILGCDNKMVYLFMLLGYEIICHPSAVRTLHYHLSQKRNYTQKDRIYPHYGMLIPYGYTMDECKKCYGQVPFLEKYSSPSEIPRIDDNRVLYNYILSCFEKNKHFVIPRISFVETHVACIGNEWAHNRVKNDEVSHIQQARYTLKQNDGILVKDMAQVVEFSQLVMNCFKNCELYGGWEREGPMYNKYHTYIDTFCKNKQMLWSEALSVYNYIYNTPWTLALRGKRILIICPFVESIREKIPIREKIYDGVDIFPDCTFVFIKPPQTLGVNENIENEDYFGVHLRKLMKDVDVVKDKYDVALVSCGGYAKPICNYIYESGKSAIHVGGVLQLYFGIIGARWLNDIPEVVKLYHNEYWSRPKKSETPNYYKTIENGCYW